MELAELEETDPAAAAGASSELGSLLGQARASLQQLSTSLDKWELRMLLSGPYDEAGALLSITAGAGGICSVQN
jgi:peptide chain release factor 2